MAVVDWVWTIPMVIDSNFAWVFDQIINCQVKWRKAEVWFVDKKKLSLVMRPWTTKVGSNTLTGWSWTSQLFFHTTFTRQRFAMRWYANKVYWDKAGVRTDIWLSSFWWNNFYYNTIRLPINYASTWVIPVSTEYTTPSNATGSEKVFPNATDTWWAANIWKYIFITDNTGNWQAYRWCFGRISWFEAGEYLLGWSWILWVSLTVWLATWSKYQIYDTIWEHLQIIDWLSYDRYVYYNSTSQTFIENTKYKWLATQWLRSLGIISWTQFIGKQIFFDNSLFTFIKWVLYRTSGSVFEPNPFFFTGQAESSATISMYWDIVDICEFKDRLIVWWTNFAKLYNKDKTIETISSTWWIKQWWFNNLNSDAYIFTTDKQLQSLVENIKWSLIPVNIWEEVQNYMDDFNISICTWFDWKRFYLYWRKDTNSTWTIVVLDVRYKFWSVWQGFTPSSIVNEAWIIYFTNLLWESVTFLDDSVQTDNLSVIYQAVISREIDLDDAFAMKKLTDIFLWLDNYDQDVKVTLYWALNRYWVTIETWIINIKEKTVLAWNWTLWEWQVWAVLLGWETFIEDISYPFFEKLTIWADQCNMFKIKIEWIDWSAFYLNQFDVIAWFYWDQKEYFSPANTH